MLRSSWSLMASLLLVLIALALVFFGLDHPSLRHSALTSMAIAASGVVIAALHVAVRRSLISVLLSLPLTAVGVLFIAGMMRFTTVPTDGRAPRDGEQAPAFTVKDVEGRDVSLAALLASGPKAVLFFRGTW